MSRRTPPVSIRAPSARQTPPAVHQTPGRTAGASSFVAACPVAAIALFTRGSRVYYRSLSLLLFDRSRSPHRVPPAFAFARSPLFYFRHQGTPAVLVVGDHRSDPGRIRWWLLKQGYSTERTREHFQAAPRLVRGRQQRGVGARSTKPGKPSAAYTLKRDLPARRCRQLRRPWIVLPLPSRASRVRFRFRLPLGAEARSWFRVWCNHRIARCLSVRTACATRLAPILFI